jgi:hypothetical protein
MMRMAARMAVAGALLVGAAGCGGDDDDGVGPVAPGTTTATATDTAPAPTTEPAKPREPRYTRTPRSLADCIGAAPAISDVLVKGGDSEDATFFADLAGGRVDVLGVTAEGEAAELTVVLFKSVGDARKAAPSAGGGGVDAEARGSALMLAPPEADTTAIEDCLGKTGYAG